MNWDLRPGLQLRLTARNLAYQAVVLRQGDLVVLRQTPATSAVESAALVSPVSAAGSNAISNRSAGSPPIGPPMPSRGELTPAPTTIDPTAAAANNPAMTEPTYARIGTARGRMWAGRLRRRVLTRGLSAPVHTS